MKNDFKVLLLYPNVPRQNPPPVSIGTFAALLRREGIEVRVFDTTYYANEAMTTSDMAKLKSLQVRPFSFDESLLPIRTSSPADDLCLLVDEFQPDLIALSVLEGTWKAGSELLSAITDRVADMNIPVLVGGIFATFAPTIVLNHPAVTFVCIGEGEGALLDLCHRLGSSGSFDDIQNLWIKKNGDIIKNPLRGAVDIDTIPIPDYEVFHPARLLRPMSGRVYRTIPIETNRGCPFSCTFCNSPTTAELYRKASAGTFFRKKSMRRLQEELRHLIRRWDAEYVYFLSDTFLALTEDEFETFVEIYSEFKLPFWMQSRAETITSYRAKKLKEIGCHRVSIGLEHGDPDFRKRILGKKYSNRQMIEAAESLHEAGIPLSVNNIIGFPDETRELVFKTIELNRMIPFDTTNAYAFTPFHGTPLHRTCLERGYITERDSVGCLTIDAPLDMPQLPRKEIMGLRKTFALYARMPKEYWPEIRIAEEDSEEGERSFEKLRKLYSEMYF